MVVLAVLLSGCATAPQRRAVCPGSPTAEAALEVLAARAATAVPVRASGQAMLTYHVPDKRRPERHNLPLELRFNPPGEIYVQGSIAVDPRAVVLGANEQQFWLAMAPREISSYYLGQWEDMRDFEGLMMSPRVVLEAFGIIMDADGEVDAHRLWTLESQGPYDVLSRQDQAGRVIQRVYVETCDYLVHKIEYFDRRGTVAAVAQLGRFQSVEGFQVPTRIHVVSTTPDGRQDSLEIDLMGARTTTFDDRQRRGLFSPPDADRFENVYRYEAGRWFLE